MTPDHDPTRSAPPDGVTASHLPSADATASRPAESAPPVPFDPPPGFSVEAELGSGGMGVVYRVRQRGLNRPVALKTVRAGVKLDTKAMIRFLAEAEAVAAIHHPNVVEVYSYGDHDGRPWLALEYCPGGDLITLTKADRTRDAAWFHTVAELAAGIADGVQAAHAAGIVHRDLKPANVLLAVDGTPKVTDFGLAKRVGGADLTQTQAVMGTPAYMSPEQASGGGKFVGPETDVWALGVMLYELASGSRPFDGTGAMEVLAAVAKADTSPLRAVCPTVPSDLALIAGKCLQKDPKERYPTAGPLANDLRNWLAGKPITARPAGLIESGIKWAKRNRRLAAMGLAVLLTMTVATAVSVSFGVEANRQADRANGKQKDAEDAAEELKQQKARVTFTLDELVVANAKTQRTLAKSLLGPIASVRWPALSEYEANAIQDLASFRDGPVGLVYLEEACRTPLAAAQFRGRAEYLYHAAVGLDAGKRRAADELLAGRLRDATVPPLVKRDVAMASVYADRFPAPAPQAAAVLSELDHVPPADAWQKGWQGRDAAWAVASVAHHLPAERAAEVLLAALAKSPSGYEGWLAGELGLAAARLPAGRAAEVCEKAAELLLTALARAKSSGDWLATARGLLAVSAHLPAGYAEGVCRRGVRRLSEVLDRDKEGNDRERIAEGLTALAGRLPAEEAADEVSSVLRRAWWQNERDEVARGLVRMAGRMPADKGVRVLQAALEWKGNGFGFERRWLAEGLAAVAAGVPADEAGDLLLAALDKAPDRSDEQRVLADGVAATADRLSAEKAAAVCRTATERLLTALGKGAFGSPQWELAKGLAVVAERLPPDEAAGVCRRVAEELLAKYSEGQTHAERLAFAEGLVAVVKRLPADKAAALLRDALDRPKAQPLWPLAAGLAAAAERMPPEEGAALLLDALQKQDAWWKLVPAADTWMAPYHGRFVLAVARGLAAVAGQMPAGRATEVRQQVADRLLTELTVAAGLLRREETPGVPADGDDTLRRAVVTRLTAVAKLLPADRAEQVFGKAADVMLESLGRSPASAVSWGFADGLLVATRHLPAGRTVAVREQTLKLLLAGLSRTDEQKRSVIADGLASVATGLSGGQRERQKCLPVLLGGVTLSDQTLQPQPLPPQQLVELLKHPFCVKEARRAVLDALEFSYARKFADLWEFVAFAEKEHPELDLLTPPKRPERK